MLRLSAVLLGAFALLSQNAFAAGNIKLGKLAIKPTVGLEERYDSNIYLVPPDLSGVRTGGGEVDAGITDLKLGVQTMFPINDMHSLSAGYMFNWLGYNKQQGTNNAVHQDADFGYQYKGPMGLKGNLFNKYKNTEDPAFSELTGRSQRWQNNIGADMEYRPEGGKLFVGVDGGQTRHKYLDEVSLGPLLDRIEYGYGLKTGYYVMPKTRLFVSYDRKFTHYTNATGSSKNNNSHAYGGGIEGQIMPTVKVEIKTGGVTRHFDQTDQATSFRATNSINWFAESMMNWKPTERCNFGLKYRRAIEESTFSNNRFYIANKVNVTASHEFPNKLKANVGLGWGVDKYTDAATTGGLTSVRRDDTYTLNLGLGYTVNDWLTASAKYQYDERFSIFSGQFNYKRHMPSLGLTASF